jgi:hypothetical protein
MKTLIALVLLMLTACSVKFELGYHGLTGRDDQTVSKEFIAEHKLAKY